MSSVTDIALQRIVPRPIPGKTYMLLPWPGWSILPLYSQEGKGEPEAKRQLPWVALTAASNVHSDWLLGLEEEEI